MRRLAAAAVLVAALLSVLPGAGLRQASAAPAAVVGGQESVSAALAGAESAAASRGVYTFAAVLDRRSGQVVARTGNADQQVASESLMKLHLTAYYLRLYGGYDKTPATVLARLSYMLKYSDDDTASALFSASAVPTVAAAYGLSGTQNAYGNAGYWGAARVTASDMARFLYAASKDPQVGPWLIPALANTAPTGSGADAGFSQAYGMNALSGEHGSKQGWGCDSYWTAPSCAIHSVGYTGEYFVAVLQLSATYPDPARATSTATAARLAASVAMPADGDFVADEATGAVYRMAGGAPMYVSSWNVFGGPRPVRVLSAAMLARLSQTPADGTFVADVSNGAVFRFAGGAPVYVSSWAPFGGARPVVGVDPAVLANAGGAGVFSHVRAAPSDGVLLRDPTSGAVFVAAGGAPLYVSSWGAIGGLRAWVDVDPVALRSAGAGGVFRFLRARPSEGTFIRDGVTRAVYQVVGGAPVYVSSWDVFGGSRPATVVDGAALVFAGSGWPFHTLSFYPADGTFVKDASNGAVFRFAGGAPVYVSPSAPFGSVKAAVLNGSAFTRAGGSGFYVHVRLRPVDGAVLRDPTSGQLFVSAGGSPLAVTEESVLPAASPAPVDVDAVALRAAGAGGVFRFLRGKPYEGTFIRDGRTGAVFQVVGGAPIYVSSWAPFGGAQPATTVDGAALERAGSGWPFHTLSFYPGAGTLVAVWPSGQVLASDGFGRLTPSTAPNSWGLLKVNADVVARAGSGGVFNHLVAP